MKSKYKCKGKMIVFFSNAKAKGRLKQLAKSLSELYSKRHEREQRKKSVRKNPVASRHAFLYSPKI